MTLPRRLLVPLVALAVLTALIVVGLLTLAKLGPPRFTEEELRGALFTAIQREAPEAFLVTGRLEMTATTRVENTKTLLPGIVGLDLGTTRASVRVPGTAAYGFYVDSLRPEMVRMQEDGTIEVDLPPLAVFSTEAQLARLEIETERGWARLGSESDAVRQRALAIVQPAIRRQALAHLRDSYQPRVNTARALERLLTPALEGLGMENPRFRFRLGGDLVAEPSG